MKGPHHSFEKPDPLPQPGVDFSIYGILEEHVVDFYIFSLSNPVNTSDSLFDAHRIPWKVKVDYDVAKLEVLAFAACFCANHN